MAELLGNNPWNLFDAPKPFPLTGSRVSSLRGHFMTSGARKWDEELAVAEVLHSENLKGKRPEESFQDYLNLFMTIQTVHSNYGKRHEPRSIGVLNGLQEHLVGLVALEHADAVTWEQISAISQQAEVLRGQKGTAGWFHVKVLKLAIALNSQKLTNQWIDGMSNRLGSATPSLDLPDINSSSSELWSVLTKDRVYGVKTCFYESPLFLGDDEVFFTQDPRLGMDAPTELQKRAVATIGVGAKPKQGVSTELNISEYQNAAQFDTKYTLAAAQGPRTIYLIDRDGEIRLNVASYLPLERAFAARGATETFKLWKLFTYMRLHDLTRRADVVERMPSIDEFEAETAKGSRRFGGIMRGGDVKEVNYRVLLVPRIRIIKPDEEEIEDKPKRFVDKHHVDWFVRPLPKTLTKSGKAYTASPEAKAYAEENDVILQEGETIVQAHDRGGKKDGKPTPSKPPIKAVFRKEKK